MSLVAREQALRDRVRRVDGARPEQVRRLVAFAHRCVRDTPLPGGRTPLSLLNGRSRLQSAVLAVGRWLLGERVERELRAMHDDVFEAALGTGRFLADMTGVRAACWSVFELYQATAFAASGEGNAAAALAGSAAALALRCGDEGPSPDAVEFQERLFAETFDAGR